MPVLMIFAKNERKNDVQVLFKNGFWVCFCLKNGVKMIKNAFVKLL